MIAGLVAGIVLAAIYCSVMAVVFIMVAPYYEAMTDEQFDQAMIALAISINDQRIM